MSSSSSTVSTAGETITTSTASTVSLSADVLTAIQDAVKQVFTAEAVAANTPRLPSLSSDSPLVSSSNHLQVSSGGMWTNTVPSFLRTFTLPGSVHSAPASQLPSLATNLTTGSSNGVLFTSTGSVPSVVSPGLHQPFVIGPGYSPVPAKLVMQIVAGKFIDLNDLLPANLLPISESEPQLMLDGRLVLTSQPKKERRKFEDIVSWIEAFSVYTMVLTSFNPKRWRDLLRYKLLIVRTYRHFSGKAWLHYDQAFREHAAATNIVDWSQMNVQLYNFHTAGSASKQSNVCRSWNRGHCSSPYSSCCYAHRCSRCSGGHKEIECPQKTSYSSSRKRDSSPPVDTNRYRKAYKQ